MTTRRIVRGARFGPAAVVVAPELLSRAGGGRRGWLDVDRPEPDPAEIVDAARRQARKIIAEATDSADRLRGEAEQRLADAGQALENARAEVEQLRAAADAQSESIRAVARDTGYREGYAAGLAAGHAKGQDDARDEMRALLDRVRQLAGSATLTKREIVADAETELVELAVDIAEKIVRRALRADSTLVAEIVEAAVAEAGLRQPARIRVHPNDWEIISAYWADAHEADGELYEFVVDERVQPGGCIVDTRAGAVDAQIETQLREIRQGLLE